MSVELGDVEGLPVRTSHPGDTYASPHCSVTAYTGGALGPCVQLTLNREFIQLDGHGVALLVDRLIESGAVRVIPTTQPARIAEPVTDGAKRRRELGA